MAAWRQAALLKVISWSSSIIQRKLTGSAVGSWSLKASSSKATVLSPFPLTSDQVFSHMRFWPYSHSSHHPRSYLLGLTLSLQRGTSWQLFFCWVQYSYWKHSHNGHMFLLHCDTVYTEGSWRQDCRMFRQESDSVVTSMHSTSFFGGLWAGCS